MKTFKQVREELKALIAATPRFGGKLVVVLEHGAAGEDVDGEIERALANAGLCVAIWMASGGMADSVRQGGASVRVSLPVSVIENPAVNFGDGADALKVSTEEAILEIMRAVLGRPCGDGTASLGQEVFARADSDAGELETVIGFEAPVIVRAR